MIFEEMKESVEEGLATLAKERLEELTSGKVQGITWEDIKKEIND